MGALYLTEQGSVLRRTGERLVVTKDGQRLQEVPIIHVEQVVVMGNVQLTTPAVALLLQKDVDVVFLSSYGKFRGRLMTTGSKFAELRHRQLQMMSEEARCLSLARAIVTGKLRNQQTVLRGLGVRGSPVKAIERAIGQVQQAGNLDSLRGFEGSAGAQYFAALRTLIPARWGFTKRIYHPPTDPVNALLSFGYTLLLKDTHAAVQLVGLDPFLGVFHALEYGRPSLVLDAMEEFRPLVDEMVLEMVLGGGVRLNDFQPPRRKDKAVLLHDEPRKGFLQAYESQISRRVRYPPTGERTTYRRCVELQVRQLARVVLGQERRYRPFVMPQEKGGGE
ncbi:MAG: CRISPR-associated endonuclease Cas1 [Chloroflexi bacterium]|nr:MAG: CRISPR-associated endonuclease Cas1 [Chloroflexota bacterium]